MERAGDVAERSVLKQGRSPPSFGEPVGLAELFDVDADHGSPSPRETLAMTSGSSKNVVALTIASARGASAVKSGAREKGDARPRPWRCRTVGLHAMVCSETAQLLLEGKAPLLDLRGADRMKQLQGGSEDSGCDFRSETEASIAVGEIQLTVQQERGGDAQGFPVSDGGYVGLWLAQEQVGPNPNPTALEPGAARDGGVGLSFGLAARSGSPFVSSCVEEAALYVAEVLASKHLGAPISASKRNSLRITIATNFLFAEGI